MDIQKNRFYFIKDEYFEIVKDIEILQNKEKYIKQNHDVIINKEKELEIYKKANKILKLVEKGYKNLVFPDIINIKNELIKEKIKR